MSENRIRYGGAEISFDTTYTDKDGNVWHHTDSSRGNTGSGGSSGADNSGWRNPSGRQNRSGVSCHTISAALKAEGRNAVLGHLGTAVGANAVYLLIVLILNLLVSGVLPSQGVWAIVLSEVLSVLVGIFTGIFAYGLDSIYMNLQYGQETRFSDLFNGLHENQDKLVRIEAVLAAIRCVCTLPAVIAAWTLPEGTAGILVWILAAAGGAADIYFSLTYSQSLYILLDFPDMSAMDVLKKSRTMMRGRKKNLLYIACSFLPLWLLSVLSLGIAGLWVFAYTQSTDAAFYRKIMEGKI